MLAMVAAHKRRKAVCKLANARYKQGDGVSAASARAASVAKMLREMKYHHQNTFGISNEANKIIGSRK